MEKKKIEAAKTENQFKKDIENYIKQRDHTNSAAGK